MSREYLEMTPLRWRVLHLLEEVGGTMPGFRIVERLVPKQGGRLRTWTQRAATRWAAAYLAPMVTAKLVEAVPGSSPIAYRITESGRAEMRSTLL